MMSDAHHYTIVMATPLPGAQRMGVVIESQRITAIDFLSATVPLRTGDSAFEHRIEQQLSDYLQTPGYFAALPLEPAGSSFQQRVWQALLHIPMGTTISYGALAESLYSSPRAVAGACRANPIPLLIPCHRVVGKSDLGGYMGATTGQSLETKRWLLRHEGAM
jgi:methylated-DNA-[protein]-cysteine S-methyltransferase